MTTTAFNIQTYIFKFLQLVNLFTPKIQKEKRNKCVPKSMPLKGLSTLIYGIAIPDKTLCKCFKINQKQKLSLSPSRVFATRRELQLLAYSCCPSQALMLLSGCSSFIPVFLVIVHKRS